jgi:hypothetical protein
MSNLRLELHPGDRAQTFNALGVSRPGLTNA